MTRLFVYESLSAGGAEAAELLPMGLAMRDAMVLDLLQIDACELSVATSAADSSVPGNAEPVRPRAGESPLDFVARQAALHQLAWIVAPETGGLLVGMHQVVGPTRWLGCDGPAIALASSKRATLRHLAARGLLTPLAFEHSPETSRWVVKPDDGAGGIDTRLHASQRSARDDGEQRARAGRPVAIEAWVDGDALSLSLLCTPGQAELLSINRQQIAIAADGALRFDGVELNTEALDGARGRVLAELAGRVAAAIPGLRGFVGIDLVWQRQHGPVMIEINPRVTCAYVGLSAALGRNLAAELVADHA